MANACPSQRRIIVSLPLIQPVDLRSLFTPVSHPLPLPLPPPQPVNYLASPFNPIDRNRVIVSGYPRVLVAPPPVLRLDHGFLGRMDEIRTQSLLLFMANEGLVPSPEEELKRKDVILQLKKIVLAWIKKVAWQRRLSKEVIACASATVLTYGSYGLGVHGTESDIDALCLGPYYATMEEDFFIVLLNMLQSRPEVSDIHCVKSAKVPLMRFKFNGISIDFPYAQIKVTSVPDDVNILEVPLYHIDETSLRSLSGVRANTSILQLVPDVKNFQSMLRCIKLWAKRRGLYSHLLGYLGGIHWAILAAYVCQRYPSASINALISIFFETFLHWPWPEPVILADGLLHTRRPDGRSFMPIMMPCTPFEWCNSNITRSTLTKITSEFQRGYFMTRDLIRDVEWGVLFEPYPYAKRFTHFVRILLVARDAVELQDWLGWVKSRFRSLLLKLEEVQGYCDPNPTEYVDHDVPEPNTVFYWGLSPMGSNFTGIDYVREEFMKSVESSGYEGPRCCKLELSIVDSSHLPKTVELESGVGKGSKACWRMLNYNQQRKPVYSQHLPYYFVGYVAPEHPSAPG